MEKKHGEWYASGKERVPGRLLLYALIVLTAVVFTTVALVVLMGGRGNVQSALLFGLLGGVLAAVIGVIIWFIYRAVALKRQK